MASISFSQNALAKILADTRIHEDLRGQRLYPILTYYIGCHSMDENGCVIEHGDGFLLKFRSLTEGVGNGYVAVKTPNDLDVFVSVAGSEPREAYVIVHSDSGFVLA